MSFDQHIRLIRRLTKSLTPTSLPSAVAELRTTDGGKWNGFAMNGRMPLASLNTADRIPVYGAAKTMLAAALLRLAEIDNFDIDSKLAKVLPDIPHGDLFSFRQLLNHTAGVPCYSKVPSYTDAIRENPGTPWSDGEVIAKTLSGDLDFTPCASWRYSHTGYMLVRMAIEKLTAASIAKALADLVFVPMGLENCSVLDSKASMDSVGKGYSTTLGGDDSVDPRGIFDPGWVKYGLVAATAADIVDFFHGLFTGALIGREQVATMQDFVSSSGLSAQFKRPSYGLGIMADPANPQGMIIGHSGEGPGWSASALICIDPDGSGLSVSVLANGECAGDAEKIALEIIEESKSMKHEIDA